MLAKLLTGYIDHIYTWKEFLDLSKVIEQMYLSDIRLANYISRKEQNCTIIKDINIEDMRRDTIEGSIERLSSYGILRINADTWGAISDYRLKTIKLTDLGKDFCNFCLKSHILFSPIKYILLNTEFFTQEAEFTAQ